MQLAPARIARSALLFVALLIPLSFGYLAVRPHYEKGLHRVAAVAGKVLSPPIWIDIGPQGHWRCHAETPRQPDRIVYRWNKDLPHLIMLSLVMVPALTLATPTTWRNRLRITGLALVLVFVSHVVTCVGLGHSMYCTTTKPGNFVCLTFLRMFYVSGQLFGVAIWGLVSWRYWFPASTRSR